MREVGREPVSIYQVRIHLVPEAAATIAAMLAPLIQADRTRPFVVAQLGQSLDGRIATPTGESRWINKDAALDHVHRLRAHVDAVLVGVGTAVADDPLLNVRRVQGRNPARVVLDPKGRVPIGSKCLDGADGCRRIVVRAAGQEGPMLPEGVEIIVIEADVSGHIDPRKTVAALFERGLRTILVEGGATTVSAFVDAGAVDHLHVLVGAMILGSGKSGLMLKTIDKLSEALRPTVRVFPLADGDVLFDCDMRSTGNVRR